MGFGGHATITIELNSKTDEITGIVLNVMLMGGLEVGRAQNVILGLQALFRTQRVIPLRKPAIRATADSPN